MPNYFSNFVSGLRGVVSDSPTSFASLGLGQLSNSLNARRNYKYAQKAAEEDLRRSREFYDYTFDKTNAYNNPSAVRARMQAAGINPYATDLSGSGAVSNFGPGTISSQSSPHLPAAAAPTGLEAAQIRKLNAETESIENQTPSAEDFAKRYSAESLGIALENVGRDYRNQVLAWDAKFAEALKGLDVAKSSAELDNLHQEYRKLIFETKLLMNENRRDPLVTEHLMRELDLQILQGGMLYASTQKNFSESLANFADARRHLIEGDTLLETLRRMRLENSFLDKEKDILLQRIQNDLWVVTRGSVNTGWGKFIHRVSQLSSSIGGLFSGSVNYGVSRGTRSSVVTKLIK